MPKTTKPKVTRAKSSGNGPSGVNPDDRFDKLFSPRELVVKTRPDAGMRAHRETVTTATTDDSAINKLLREAKATMSPLFGESEERLQMEANSLAPNAVDGAEVPDLSVYYHVEAPDEELDALAKKMCALGCVEAAYVKPAAEPPQEAALAATREEMVNEMAALIDEAPAATPNFVSRQNYLDPAPAGVDARYAWSLSGGRGRGISIIDLEWGWRFNHEDLRTNQGGVVGGNASSNDDHGTAVLGVMSGDRNNYGITGICPDSRVSAIAFSMPTAQAIRLAANRLRRGDIMLLEVHRAGPNSHLGAGQFGYIAIEWWPDDYDAIRYAVAKGIVVVEAAGNGAQNLDDAIYDRAPAGFPADWSNPFRRGAKDSGAIIVGAGAPPPGTHGRNHGPDRSRLGFSNYGAAVDAQGWGREVTTTGYGDLQGGSNRNEWYTDRFSGTSSASPIVVGALACTQGVLKRRGQVPMSPIRARKLLRSTGTLQQDAPGRPRSQRIGNRPNLRQLIPAALRQNQWRGVQFRGTVGPRRTQRWFTHSWPPEWQVLWSVVPTSTHRGGPQIKYEVQVERPSHGKITYWIVVTNLTDEPATIEARYSVTGQH